MKKSLIDREIQELSRKYNQEKSSLNQKSMYWE
jgi:hypothetical protein